MSPLPRCYHIYSTDHCSIPVRAVPIPIISAVISQNFYHMSTADYCSNIPTAAANCDTVCCCSEAADSCALNAVCFLTQSEVAAVNSVGQFKIWDLRQPSADPVRIFVP